MTAADQLPRNHPAPDVPRSADTMRAALQINVCCANHAAEIALVAAISFAADVARDDRAEMKRFIVALTDHVFAQLERGKIKFARPSR